MHLEPEELDLLARAAGEFNWRQVEPAIFGGLLQGALGKERQWALGAHYTAEADILKIVLPTVVEPWRERIAACRTVDDVTAAQNALMHYVVLDPACGSGNFLYVAYRELRRIEAELRRRATDMRRNAGLAAQQTLSVYFPLSNMKGIELDPFAVQLARVTLWMGHKLAVDELAMVARRSEICLERQIGLTRLYNEVDDGAYRDLRDLRDLHVALDEAVAAAYGWPASAAHDPAESNRLLLELNRAISSGEVAYHPFG